MPRKKAPSGKRLSRYRMPSQSAHGRSPAKLAGSCRKAAGTWATEATGAPAAPRACPAADTGPAASRSATYRVGISERMVVLPPRVRRAHTRLVAIRPF